MLEFELTQETVALDLDFRSDGSSSSMASLCLTPSLRPPREHIAEDSRHEGQGIPAARKPARRCQVLGCKAHHTASEKDGERGDCSQKEIREMAEWPTLWLMHRQLGTRVYQPWSLQIRLAESNKSLGTMLARMSPPKDAARRLCPWLSKKQWLLGSQTSPAHILSEQLYNFTICTASSAPGPLASHKSMKG